MFNETTDYWDENPPYFYSQKCREQWREERKEYHAWVATLKPYIEAKASYRDGKYAVWASHTEDFFNALKKDGVTDELERNRFPFRRKFDTLVKDLKKRLEDGEWNDDWLCWMFNATPKAREILIECGLLAEDEPVPEEPAPPVRKERDIEECVRLFYPELFRNETAPERRRREDKKLAEGVKIADGKYRLSYGPDMRADFGKIPGCYYDRRTREWVAPETAAATGILAGLGLVDKDLEPDFSRLQGPALYPFQTEGVKRLCEMGLCAILADPPGTGKTAQAICASWAMEALPCVVLCPKTRIGSWIADIQRFAKGASITRLDKDNRKWREIKHFVVCDFEMMSEFGDYLIRAHEWTHDRCAVIVDECHRVGRRPILECDEGFDPENAYHSAGLRKPEGRLWQIVEKAYHRLFISSYRLETKPGKFYDVLKFLVPDKIGSHIDFGEKYCDPTPSEYSRTGFVYNGASNTDDLWELVKGVFVRREISEIEGQVPAGFLKKKKK